MEDGNGTTVSSLFLFFIFLFIIKNGREWREGTVINKVRVRDVKNRKRKGQI